VALVEKVGAGQVDESQEVRESAAGQPAPFSFDVALNSLDNDADLLVQQMQFFINDGPNLVGQIERAIADRDDRALEVAAHRLKGLLARYAFHEASGLAYDLEQMGRQHAVAGDATTKVNQLAQMVHQLVSAMRAYLEQRASS
jgi:HPt (histidine-containing phosphotransfer) domain-containing protein